MRPQTVRFLLGLLVIVGGSCSSSPSSVGGVRQPCYANGTCNTGLQCFSMVCVSTTDGGTTGAGGASAGAGGGTAGMSGGSTGALGGTAGGSAGTAGGTGGSSGAGGGSAGAGGTSQAPPLAGLTLWLDASKGVTTCGVAVVIWADQSASAENAAALDPDPTPARSASVLNGHDAILFTSNPATYLTLGGSGTDWASGSFLLELVVRVAINGSGTYWGQQGLLELANDFSLAVSNSSGTIYPIVQTPTSYDDGSVHSVGMWRDGNNISLLLDGAIVGTEAISATFGSGVNLGAFDGDLFEIVGKNAAVSAGEVAAVESYFHTKYGTP